MWRINKQVFRLFACFQEKVYMCGAVYYQPASAHRCWTTIGRDGGKQVVSLSVDGCLDRGVIQHELLHALGFHHEHTRSDRDQYVRINWDKIPAGELQTLCGLGY